jgi:hypothetical protein
MPSGVELGESAVAARGVYLMSIGSYSLEYMTLFRRLASEDPDRMGEVRSPDLDEATGGGRTAGLVRQSGLQAHD